MPLHPDHFPDPGAVNKLIKALGEPQAGLQPMFSPVLRRSNTVFLDFSSGNKTLDTVDLSDTKQLNRFVFDQIKKAGACYGFGGYMEDRAVYRRSAHFAPAEGPPRSIHLGVDVWAEAGTPVYLPFEGKLHSFQVNDTFGDYGPTIIMEHDMQGMTFFTLYGHLSPESLHGLVAGKTFRAGEPFCRIGDFPVNGDWPPHLHFQLITDMMGKTGDFPGVCLPAEKQAFQVICPDPIVFFPELVR